MRAHCMNLDGSRAKRQLKLWPPHLPSRTLRVRTSDAKTNAAHRYCGTGTCPNDLTSSPSVLGSAPSPGIRGICEKVKRRRFSGSKCVLLQPVQLRVGFSVTAARGSSETPEFSNQKRRAEIGQFAGAISRSTAPRSQSS